MTMRNFTFTLLTGIILAVSSSTASADDDIFNDDGVVHLVSTSPGYSEYFRVVREDDEIEISHLVNFGSGWDLVNDRDYSIENLDAISFLGDNDRDILEVGWFGYFDETRAVLIPVLAYGLSGNDELHGGQLQCELHGGDGQDLLVGTFGSDLLDPGADPIEDTLIGVSGVDTYVKWQSWQLNPQTGYYSYQDYQSFNYEIDFDADEDEWLIKKKAMPNKSLIMNGGKISNGPKLNKTVVDLDQLSR